MYIYTELGEKKAKEYGVEERKAGNIAMIGGKVLQSGSIATAWKKKGYIKEV